MEGKLLEGAQAHESVPPELLFCLLSSEYSRISPLELSQ